MLNEPITSGLVFRKRQKNTVIREIPVPEDLFSPAIKSSFGAGIFLLNTSLSIQFWIGLGTSHNQVIVRLKG